MAKVTYDSVVSDLRQRKGSIKRSELIEHLHSLGFKVHPGRKGNHYTYIHQAFTVFPGGTFNGEHTGKDPVIKLPSILDVLRLLSKYESEVREFLGEMR